MFLFFSTVSVLLFCSTARGQAISPSPINPTPSPLAETASKSESASVSLQEIKASLSSDRTTTTIEHELPLLTSEIDILFRDGARILSSNPPGDILHSMTTSLKLLIKISHSGIAIWLGVPVSLAARPDASMKCEPNGC
jgi:hypothetical protein